ncbi:phosphoglycolate phosphatase [Orbus hercynius]|uniref:Phosphoglycolate phosphatase n=1 Tax=Orbus hercynius TaxID=593135 RepID=A0A495RC51_9GAMM|nr:phosphoglycolate phosphatase [Orbus hercynius]RKS84774.1 phosphoglycolate phosphatase [Orbus hercynius]
MKKLTDIQAIAFDLDGTLVDSVPGLALAAQRMLADLSLPTVTHEQIKIWVGNGIDVLIERILASVSAPESIFDQAKPLFNRHYDETIDEGTQVFPHVISTLATLQQQGYRMALVTNKPAQFLPALLKSLKLDPYFSLVLGGGDVIKLKPHPAPLYQVMANFGLYHDQLLFVGDSRNDISAAKNALCPTVGLTYGYNYGESITSSSPDYVFENFEQLLTILPRPRAEAKK